MHEFLTGADVAGSSSNVEFTQFRILFCYLRLNVSKCGKSISVAHSVFEITVRQL